MPCACLAGHHRKSASDVAAPRCVARFTHPFGPMLWRQSWTFGYTMKELLRIASTAWYEETVASITSSIITWLEGEIGEAKNVLAGTLPNSLPRPLPAAYPEDPNAWYCSGAFNIASSRWQDCTGNGKTATLSGSGLAESRSAGHGTTSEVLALSGTTESVIAFGDVIQREFTVCSVTRYTGGAKKRILQGGGANWLHGHYAGDAGVAHYKGWKTSTQGSVSPDTDWVVMCGTNAGSQLKLVNGVDVGTATGGTGGVSLFVNAGDAAKQKSDFAIAEVVVWPRGLTSEEMHRVSDHLMNRMG